MLVAGVVVAAFDVSAPEWPDSGHLRIVAEGEAGAWELARIESWAEKLFIPYSAAGSGTAAPSFESTWLPYAKLTQIKMYDVILQKPHDELALAIFRRL